ncbi:glycosyltransferase [Vibrio splendidus]|uniref:glycosyltransferase n=1 Tax=Vibrio splendidus TaxID=29497 RepID=UPI000D36D447|nr:glycosyltransferase [Vibrio splendidus]PTO78185.1 hypothetical protein CWN93_19880 [Vibrio splendidus]
MKVTYLTWGETPRSYGVFSSQVLGQFIQNSKIIDNADCEFVSAVPIIHSGLIREKFSYRNELRSVKSKLNNSEIEFTCLPIFTTQNFVNSTKTTFGKLHGGAHKRLANHFFKRMPEIVHCRSYHATYAAIKVREEYDFNYKVIFDARGYWPFEVSLKKNQNLDSSDLAYLKGIEKFCLNNSDQIIGVSDTMSEYFKSLAKTPVETVYLSADTSVLGSLERNLKLNEKKKIKFCYLGALSPNTWHRPKELADLYNRLRELVPNCSLMIITTSKIDDFSGYFSHCGDGEVTYHSSSDILELKSLLKKCDIGLMSYFIPKDYIQKILADSVMAVKTAEYLVAGMPMIVNQYCGGARVLLEKYKLGLSYDPENLETINSDDIEKLLTIDLNNLQYKARKCFDIELNSYKYVSIYKKLSNKLVDYK